MSRALNLLGAALALCGALLAGAALAQTTGTSPRTEAPAPRFVLNAANLEPWLDGYMLSALGASGVPGAVVSVVKDGEIILSKGYGFADVAKRLPVDGRTTLFRVGSISKLFTWTAVMQLVERGRIDLDSDINKYLDFEIPPFQGQPITMRHLMTHTAGFEEAKRGLATQKQEALIPLGQAVKQALPARVYAPGSTPAYSNYGTALAGYIVERQSGERFTEYVSRHIFQPLNMQRSTFQQPLPPALAPSAAGGYMSSFSAPGAFELVNWAPAGGLSTTGEDMARFMLAHLATGDAGQFSVLSESSLEKMRAAGPEFVPALNRSTLGFAERHIGGRRAIGHDGDTVLFHSLLVMYPQQGIGIFASFSSPGVQGAVWAVRDQLVADFSDRYLPATEQPMPGVTAETAAAHAKMFAPDYTTSRSSSTSFMKAKKLLLPIRVVRHSDGTVSLSGLRGLSGELKRFREVAPFLWHEVGGHDRLAGIERNGRIVRIGVDDVSATAVFDAVPASISPSWLLPAFTISLLVLACSLLAWPAGAFLARRYGTLTQATSNRARADRIARVAFAVAILAALAWSWIFMQALDPVRSYLLSEHDTLILFVEGLTLVGFLGALSAAICRAWVVWRSDQRLWPRLGSMAQLLATGVIAYAAWAYNLMTFSVAY